MCTSMKDKRLQQERTDRQPFRLAVIHLNWDEALVLQGSGEESASLVTSLRYLAEQAIRRGERDRAVNLLDAARSI